MVGAAKAGTTSIYNYLKEHPDVYLPSEMKEINFLGGVNPAVRDESDYLALYRKGMNFPSAWIYRRHTYTIPALRCELGTSWDRM